MPSRRETTVKSLLQDAKTVKWDNEEACLKFGRKHRARLSKSPGNYAEEHSREALHDVADADSKEFGQFVPFARWAIREHGQLLELRSDGDLTPLHLAIRKRNDQFVNLVLEEADADRVRSILGLRANLGMTCLHFAIKYKSPFTEKIISKAQLGPGHVEPVSPWTPGGVTPSEEISEPPYISVFKAPMTPLHMAMIVDVGNDNRDQQDGGDEGESDYMSDEGDESDGSDMASTIDGRGNFARDGADNYRTTYDMYDGPDGNRPNMRAIRRAPTGDFGKLAATSPGGALGQPTTTSFDLPTIVMRLIDACPEALLEKNADDETPFQARLSSLLRSRLGHRGGERGPNEPQQAPGAKASEASRARQREEDRRNVIENDAILSYMRQYIIDKFDRRRAMRALYRVGDERVLEFDLSGLPYSKINADFLGGLGKVLRFEGMLKYVALPRLEWVGDDVDEIDRLQSDSEQEDADPGLASSLAQAERGGKSKGKGLWNMCPIFEWLEKQHVKSVLKVAVIDDMQPSHSDKAIEKCLSGFDIRVWNWYKVDVCSSVILRSAKHVRDVTLYSSGNNAVLMGWSSPGGLPKLAELKKVHVFVQEGLESPRRLARNMNSFVKTLKATSAADDLVVTWELQKPDPHYSSVFTEGSIEQETEPRWMKAMVDFAEFLKRVHQNADVPAIKIAVIDDGIDTALDDFTGKIQVGESFYRLSELTGRRGAYYVPSGPHGTLMAQLICRVCPMVKLYIAQLEVLPGQDGGRSFTIDSATEAIRWAVDQGVDIISMSWSINSTLPRRDLEAALDAAHRERIVMFCSSIDEGPTAVDRTYPGRNANCIKIGASTWSGARLSWVSETNSQFLLPGEAAPGSIGRSSSSSSAAKAAPPSSDTGGVWSYPHRGMFGSSVATALAAGLAGVLLYCDRLLGAQKLPIHDVPKPAGPAAVIMEAGGGGGGGGSGLGSPGILVRRQSEAPRVEYLRHEGKMVEAFAALSRGTNKFVQVWSELPDNPDKLVWNDTEEGRESKRDLEQFMARFRR